MRRVTIRIDNDLLDSLCPQVCSPGNAGNQALLNEALREHVAAQRETFERTPRRFFTQELNALEKAKLR
ncbi:MAG: hypothetical protein AMXMBFR4_19160 [Candidatus Hydrogenedentota bacterium]